MYTIDAGYLISVTTLNYYLSDIKLIKTDGTKELIKAYHYASIVDPLTNEFTISSGPEPA